MASSSLHFFTHSARCNYFGKLLFIPAVLIIRNGLLAKVWYVKKVTLLYIEYRPLHITGPTRLALPLMTPTDEARGLFLIVWVITMFQSAAMMMMNGSLDSN